MDIIVLLLLILNNKLSYNFFNRTNASFFLLIILLLNTRNRNISSSSLKKKNNFNTTYCNSNKVNANDQNKKRTPKQNKKIFINQTPSKSIRSINKNNDIHTKTNNSKNISKPVVSNYDSIIRSNPMNNKPKNYYNKNYKFNTNKYLSILDEHTEKPSIKPKINNFKNTYKKSILNSDSVIKSNSVNNKIQNNYSKNKYDKINSNKFVPTLDKHSKEVSNNPIIDSLKKTHENPTTNNFKNTSDKTTLNSNSTTKSNSKHNYIKNNYIESDKIKSNEIASILNEYYRGSTVSIIVRDLGVITGNIVLNLDSVIALKLKNNITVFINKDLISSFF
ncbi:hypothetical protein [Clostridium sardiniense]|uniref:hypothetical protein n=1 Tax=Clostridium sardiniense TaxID=29369 RepID=UPI003D348058